MHPENTEPLPDGSNSCKAPSNDFFAYVTDSDGQPLFRPGEIGPTDQVASLPTYAAPHLTTRPDASSTPHQPSDRQSTASSNQLPAGTSGWRKSTRDPAEYRRWQREQGKHFASRLAPCVQEALQRAWDRARNRQNGSSCLTGQRCTPKDSR